MKDSIHKIALPLVKQNLSRYDPEEVFYLRFLNLIRRLVTFDPIEIGRNQIQILIKHDEVRIISLLGFDHKHHQYELMKRARKTHKDNSTTFFVTGHGP